MKKANEDRCSHFWVHSGVEETKRTKMCKRCKMVLEVDVAELVRDFEEREKIDWSKHRKAAQKARHGL